MHKKIDQYYKNLYEKMDKDELVSELTDHFENRGIDITVTQINRFKKERKDVLVKFLIGTRLFEHAMDSLEKECQDCILIKKFIFLFSALLIFILMLFFTLYDYL